MDGDGSRRLRVQAPKRRSASEIPVLIVGMPRCGAALLELSGLHPDDDSAERAWDAVLGYVVRALDAPAG